MLFRSISPGNKDLYEKVVEPAFEATHGRAPADRHEVRKEMEKENYYRAWCVLQRASQEKIRSQSFDVGSRSSPGGVPRRKQKRQ